MGSSIYSQEISFGDLLGGNNRYKVPDYQRDFSWTDDEVETLWKDIENTLDDSDTEHFMGAIVVAEDDLAAYFVHHQRRMQYLEFREEGFPIGSGTVESGVKQFKQRLTGTGMRWNADNADRMLIIRAAVLGNDFAALWTDAA